MPSLLAKLLRVPEGHKKSAASLVGSCWLVLACLPIAALCCRTYSFPISHVTTNIGSGLSDAARHCRLSNDSVFTQSRVCCPYLEGTDCMLKCAGTETVAKTSTEQLICLCCKPAARRASTLLQGRASGTLASITPALAAQYYCMMHLATMTEFQLCLT